MNRTTLATLLIAALVALRVTPVRTVSASVAPLLHTNATPVRTLDDSLLGYSGKLRVRFLPVTQATALERALGRIRAATLATGTGAAVASLQVISMVPFTSKVAGRMGMYRMGYWPGERRAVRSSSYDNPLGFIEVTPANQYLKLSEHFTLRDFVTKDQVHVWPKYVVLREALIDKLELVIDELHTMGYRANHLQVMSGFRHPFYNAQGVGKGGRARESRHQYGDAGDVFVDDDGDGRMDDLDGDGRITTLDTDALILAVERVEQAHPELTGGMGRYHATEAHGPFVHVDVRGTPARWGGA